MRYIEISIDTPSHLIDTRCEELSALGAEGFVIENEEDFHDFLENNHQYWDYVDQALEDSYKGVSRIKLYLTDDPAGQETAERIRAAFPESARILTEDIDWENNWKEFYVPIEVGKQLVVVPEWLEAPADGRIPLRLDPGIAFGTGSHPTTRLSLAAMEPHVQPGCRVLDLGCGSGILGIGSLLLGAALCVGCDIDPLAAESTASNGKLNGFNEDRLRIYTGDLVKGSAFRESLGSHYDLVLANIVADVIIALAPYVQQFLSAKGIFICSGIIDNRVENVKQTLLDCGFEITSHTQEEEWHCFICRWTK